MKKVRDYFFIAIVLGMSVVVFVPKNVYAKQDIDFEQRIAMINRELECVTQKLTRNNDVTWQDVCYTDSSVMSKPERRSIIDEALNRAERKQTRERQRKFPQQPAFDYIQDALPASTRYQRHRIIHAEGDESSGLVKYQYQRRGGLDERPVQATIQVMAGHRTDGVDWNIAGNIDGTSPNILAEYTWNDLLIAQVKTKANIIFNNRLVLDGMAAYGKIYSGDSRVSEYDADNRTSEVSQTDNSGDEGETLDLSGGLGYRFYLGEKMDYFELDHFWITPLVGYSYHEQNLNIKEGNQIIDTGGMLGLGPFSGLDSPYDLQWKGPWFGIEMSGIKDRLSGTLRFEYHNADYHGKGVSNLQPTFKKFEHSADGHGMVLNIGLGYQLNDHWRLNFNADLQDWKTDPGIDRLTFTNGSIRETRLNQVNWQSYALMLGATLQL